MKTLADHGMPRAATALLLLLAAPALLAQEITGQVRGTIRDSSGGVLPGAAVELRNVGTNIAATQTTGAEGTYTFNFVNPGPYELRVTLDGFKQAARRLTVETNGTSTVDLPLEVGSVSETVEVTATAAPVETARAHVSTNVDAKLIQELPNIAFDVTTMVNLAPGATRVGGNTVGGASGGGSQVVDISGNYALGQGTRRSQSSFYVDGAENMGSWRNQALQLPTSDAVQEMQVITSTASAEFGKNPGVTTLLTTKSGTNSFHGTAGFYFHDEGLNANSWSRNKTLGDPNATQTQKDAAVRPNDPMKWFSATLGGPILRDRTFFFASVQRYSNTEDASFFENFYLPTPAMLAGDFSAIPAFSVRTVNPATGQPFGSAIPVAQMDPVARAYKDLFPTVDVYGQRNAFIGFSRPTDNLEYLAKIDHKLTGSQSLSLMYLGTRGDQTRPDGVSGVVNNLIDTFTGAVTNARQHTATARHTWSMKPNVLLETRAAFARLWTERTFTLDSPDLNEAGANWPSTGDGIEPFQPFLRFSGTGPQAGGGTNEIFTQQNFRLMTSLSWVKGNHNLKFGAEAQWNDYSLESVWDRATFNYTGAFSFSGGPQVGPLPSAPRNPSGDNTFAYAWADFLLGRTSSFSSQGPTDSNLDAWSYYLFVQDQWRVTPRLTVSPGIRYELYGQLDSTTGFSGYQLGARSRFPNAPDGFVYDDDPGIRQGLVPRDYDNIAPRLGVAYDLFGDARTALRAGWGFYYANPTLAIYDKFSGGPGTGASSLGGANANTFDPWLTSRVNATDPNPQFATYPTPLATSREAVPRTSFSRTPRGWAGDGLYTSLDIPDYKTPSEQQFNVAVEHQIVNGVTAEVAYVGKRGNGLVAFDTNRAVWAPGATTGNVNARRPNQSYNRLDVWTTDGKTSYDSLQVASTVRRNPVYLVATYVLQRYVTNDQNEFTDLQIGGDSTTFAANPRDFEGERANVVPRHLVRAFAVVDLPGLENRWADLFLGGWQVAGNFSWRSGEPINITLGPDWNVDGVGGDRPDQSGDLNYLREPNAAGQMVWFDRTSISPIAPATADNPYIFGNMKRNAAWGPSAWSLDASLMKTFKIRGSVRLQVRADAVNVLNHADWANPQTSLSNTNFGLILTKNHVPRTIQLGAKVLF